MKNRPWILIPVILLGVSAPAQAQNESAPEPTVVERGANHRVWEWKLVRTLPNGLSITNRTSFMELETVMQIEDPIETTRSQLAIP